MDRLGCLGALQSIENELAAFTADPSDCVPQLEAALASAELRVQASRDALIEAERRVLEIAGRAPYAQLAEVWAAARRRRRIAAGSKSRWMP